MAIQNKEFSQHSGYENFDLWKEDPTLAWEVWRSMEELTLRSDTKFEFKKFIMNNPDNEKKLNDFLKTALLKQDTLQS